MRRFKVTVNGREYDVEVVEMGGGGTEAEPAAEPAAAHTPTKRPAAPPVARSAPSGPLKRVDAPLAGAIISVRSKPGDQVKAGDVLLTLEALKLENEIASPYSGVVHSVNVSAGESVEAGALLATIEESGS